MGSDLFKKIQKGIFDHCWNDRGHIVHPLVSHSASLPDFEINPLCQRHSDLWSDFAINLEILGFIECRLSGCALRFNASSLDSVHY